MRACPILPFLSLTRLRPYAVEARLLALDWFIQAVQLICIVFAYQSSDSPSADILPVHNDPPPDTGKIYQTSAQEDGDLIMDITITNIIRLLRARVTTPLAQNYTPPPRASLLPIRDQMAFLIRGRAGSLGESMAASRLARGTAQRTDREDADEGQGASTGRIPGGLD